MIEIESRARVQNIEAAEKELEERGAIFLQEKRQIDRVFGHDKFLDENRKIVEGGLSARIRKVNEQNPRLDFKEIIRESGGIEVSSDLDSIEEGEKFLDKLGFEEAFTVDKKRRSYKLNGFEICLDVVKKLGKFIEVEKEINNEEKKEETIKECRDLLKSIASDPEFIESKYGDLMQERINQGKDI